MWATDINVGRREGAVRRGVEVEVAGEAELLGDVDFGGLVGMVEVGLPLLGVAEVERCEAQDGEKRVGAPGIDHVGGHGFGELGESGLHGVHAVERRELEVKALAAGAHLGHAKLARAVAQVVGAVRLVFGGDGVAGVAGVVDVRTGTKWL